MSIKQGSLYNNIHVHKCILNDELWMSYICVQYKNDVADLKMVRDSFVLNAF